MSDIAQDAQDAHVVQQSLFGVQETTAGNPSDAELLAITQVLAPPQDDQQFDIKMDPTESDMDINDGDQVDDFLQQTLASLGPEGKQEQVPKDDQSQDNNLQQQNDVQNPPQGLLETGRAAALAFAARNKNTIMSKTATLENAVLEDPEDTESWTQLIKEVESKGDLEKCREVYEKFLAIFPTATQQWLAYIKLEQSHSHFEQVGDLFNRALKDKPPFVALWSAYISFIRRVNPINAAPGPTGKTSKMVITECFEYSLGIIGCEREAGTIWDEYIRFLKDGKPVVPNTGNLPWEDQQRMDDVRKAYKRAVVVPLENVESIWSDYNSWEATIGKITAKKYISELSPSYMTARKVLRELRAQFESIPQPALPHRPDWGIPLGQQAVQDARGLEKWRKYLAFELSNPLDLEIPEELRLRITNAFKRATAHLRFFPEVWYLSADYAARNNFIEDALNILKDGIKANPKSLLLSYTIVELDESRLDYQSCHTVFDNLIDQFNTHIDSLQSATENELENALLEFDGQQVAVADDAESRERAKLEREEIEANIKAKREGEIELATKTVGNVWIAYMRFAKRAEGIKSARMAFGKARKSKHLTWQVLSANAQMEYFCNGDVKVATNVFELGLKSFSKDIEYVGQYLDFLLMTNNSNNARVLFERTVALVEPEKAKPLWDKWSRYEHQYGDFLSSQTLYKRYSEMFPDVSPFQRFVDRFGYHGMNEGLSQDLGSLAQLQSSETKEISFKRGFSSDPFMNNPGPDAKRSRLGNLVESSPAPSSNVGMEDDRRKDKGQNSNNANNANKPPHYFLDPRGSGATALLSEGIVQFIGLLPSMKAFMEASSPPIDSNRLVDVIQNTKLPSGLPVPGGSGERGTLRQAYGRSGTPTGNTGGSARRGRDDFYGNRSQQSGRRF